MQQGVQLRLGMTEASNELSDEDQECHNKLFSCPEKGCIKSFQRFLSLQHHLDVGRHSYALENETLFDKTISSFATKLEQGTATVKNPVEDIEASQALNSCPSLPKGWALKSMSIQRTWLNESHKHHLTEVFQIGKRTGHKADPSYVLRRGGRPEMRMGPLSLVPPAFWCLAKLQVFFTPCCAKSCYSWWATEQRSRIPGRDGYDSGTEYWGIKLKSRGGNFSSASHHVRYT